MKILSKIKNSENGQSAVEFALIFPLLMVILLGIIEFGWFLNAKITITSAAREAVRVYAITNNEAAASTAALDRLLNTNITGEIVVFDPDVNLGLTDPNITMVSATITADVHGLTGGAFTGLVNLLTGNDTAQYNVIPMSSEAIMRAEY